MLNSLGPNLGFFTEWQNGNTRPSHQFGMVAPPPTGEADTRVFGRLLLKREAVHFHDSWKEGKLGSTLQVAV